MTAPSSVLHLAVTPVDLLYLRGNHLFGATAGHSQALMPPWPSVMAGAIRSRMLVDEGVNLAAFAGSASRPSGPLGDSLGTPDRPGSFAVAGMALAKDETTFVPLPADVIVHRHPDNDDEPCVHRLTPGADLGALTSSALLRPAVLPCPVEGKPVSSLWLDAAGLETWRRGGTPAPDSLHPGAPVEGGSGLWATETRLGLGLDSARRASDEGQLYTSETVSLSPGVYFLVGVSGAPLKLLPSSGLLRLGGDGRGAEVSHSSTTLPWLAKLPPDGRSDGCLRFTLCLASPGIFPGAWLPPGVKKLAAGWFLERNGLKAKLVSAAVPRYEVVSGWDIAKHAPKPAQRVAPTGSVYWFEVERGSRDAVASLAGEIANGGLWPLYPNNDWPDFDPRWEQRRAEGFNRGYVGWWRPLSEEE